MLLALLIGCSAEIDPGMRFEVGGEIVADCTEVGGGETLAGEYLAGCEGIDGWYTVAVPVPVAVGTYPWPEASVVLAGGVLVESATVEVLGDHPYTGRAWAKGVEAEWCFWRD